MLNYPPLNPIASLDSTSDLVDGTYMHMELLKIKHPCALKFLMHVDHCYQNVQEQFSLHMAYNGINYTSETYLVHYNEVAKNNLLLNTSNVKEHCAYSKIS